MPKIEPFEKYYKQYEEWFEKNEYVYKSELEAVKHFIPKNKKGFEIGVGSGRFAKPLGINIGIDPSMVMAKLAREREISVYNGKAENLPIKDSVFDFVLMVATICFLDDIKKSFLEVYRILKPKGLFIIGFIDKGSPLGQSYQGLKAENRFYKIAEFYSTSQILSLWQKTRFRKLAVIQTVFGKSSSISQIQNFKRGYDKGGFVVIKSVKEG